ncbi:hypothetical protein ACF8PD_13500 [Vibrio plantisponsor]|uniref:hypothetical protein n=1 Tax=Vibrio plantisponsor TaxID=664643 RepID=UPI00370B5EB3
MPCVRLIKDGQVIGHVCGEGVGIDDWEFPVCSGCGNNYPKQVDFLCDFPVGDEKTCDRLLCHSCARVVGKDMHYCETHYQEWKEFRDKNQDRLISELSTCQKFIPIK